jgi:hypothetical protein
MEDSDDGTAAAGAAALLAAVATAGTSSWPATATGSSGNFDPGSTTGNLEAVLHALADLQKGQALTVRPLPLAVSIAVDDPAPGDGKRPRRAAARSALAVLQAEHQQAEAGPRAAFPELEGRLFRFSVAGARAAPQPAPWQQHLAGQQAAAAHEQQLQLQQQRDRVAAAAAKRIASQQRQKQQHHQAEVVGRESAEPVAAPQQQAQQAAPLPAAITIAPASCQTEQPVPSASQEPRQQAPQQGQQPSVQPSGSDGAAAAAAAATVAALDETAEPLSASTQQRSQVLVPARRATGLLPSVFVSVTMSQKTTH